MNDVPPDPLAPAEALDADHVRMLADLTAGRPVSDRAFDRLFPEPIRRVSSRFWTPVVVARRVTKLFAASGANRVLDIGAGPGKLCLIGAATTDATFHGVEHRPHLVAVAKRLARALGLSRAGFLHGTLDDIDWSAYEALYLYNPFEENLFDHRRRLDDSVACSAERFRTDITRLEAVLDSAPAGMRVVTFQGFQGKIPATYRRLPEETRGTPFLNSWVKAVAGSSGGEGIFDGYLPETNTAARQSVH